MKYLGTGAAAGINAHTSTVYEPTTANWFTVIALKMFEVDTAFLAEVIVTIFAFSRV